MTSFLEKILNKTRPWVLPLAFLKAFFPLFLGLSQLVEPVILWPLRSLLVILGMLGLTLGTLSIYLDIVGGIYYLVKKRRKDRIFLWALLLQNWYFFYVLLGNPIIWSWDWNIWSSYLDFTFGGPFLWGELFPLFFRESLRIIFHPSYIPSPFNE